MLAKTNSIHSSSVGGSSRSQSHHQGKHSVHSLGSDLLHHHDHTKFDPDRFFVVPRGVILQYGPYTFHGVCDFRVERLQGIQKALQKLGARVQLVPSTDFLNRMNLWYMDNVIFSCKITDLQHGGDGELDFLATSAARAFDHESRRSIRGLQHRINVDNQELLDPFCPCINPNFFGTAPVNEKSTVSDSEKQDKDGDETGQKKNSPDDNSPNEGNLSTAAEGKNNNN